MSKAVDELKQVGITTTGAYIERFEHPAQHSCPNCGYCPHCGRGGYARPYWQPPYYPYIGDWPNYQGTITTGGTSGNISGVSPQAKGSIGNLSNDSCT